MAAASPSRRWRRRGIVATLALIASYVDYAMHGQPHGGAPIGLAYGVLASLAIAVLLYFGVRKRSYRSTWGTLEGWLQAHIYIGLLAVLVVLLHTGFRFQDRVAIAAYVMLLAVVGSGIGGVFLYRQVPRRLSEVEGDLPPADLAAQLDQLAAAMVRLAGRRSAAFQQVCRGLLAETVPRPLAGWRTLFSRAGGGRRASRAGGGVAAAVAVHLARVPAAEQGELRQLLVLSRQRGELLERLVAQQHFRNLLAAWLYIHVPLSIALVVLVGAHVAAVFYFARPVS